MRKIKTISAVACLQCLALAASAQTIKGKLLEEKVLEGPCSTVQSPGPDTLTTRQQKAAKLNDHTLAVDLARQIVRGNCTNEHWWLRLAESLVDAAKPEEAIAALEALYARQSNEVERRLRTADSPLKKLAQSDAWHRSALAAKITQDRKDFDLRQKAARLAMETAPHPPRNYIATNACPGEGCSYGPAVLPKDTALFASPGATLPIATIPKGDAVQLLSGEVHLHPNPVLVRLSAPSGIVAKVGSVVWLLNFHGEGYGSVWVNGKIVTAFWGVQEQCRFPNAEVSNKGCWGEFLQPPDPAQRYAPGSWDPATVWWVRLRTKTGQIGWTKEAGNFDIKR